MSPGSKKCGKSVIIRIETVSYPEVVLLTSQRIDNSRRLNAHNCNICMHTMEWANVHNSMYIIKYLTLWWLHTLEKNTFLFSFGQICAQRDFFPHSPCDKTVCHGRSNSPGWALLRWWGLWWCSCQLNYLNSLKNCLGRGRKKSQVIFVFFQSIECIAFLCCNSAT